MIRAGYSFPLQSYPPLTDQPPLSQLPQDQEVVKIIDNEIQSLITKGAIVILSDKSPGFYSRIFTVRKKTGGFRPVLDLSHLNYHLKKIRFRMETTASIRLAIQPGDWATSIDLTDAYFHLLIHPNRRHLLRFVWKDVAYQFKALPFGLSLAPWIFTRIVKEFAAILRRESIRIHIYLDDWLVLNQARQMCEFHTQTVIDKATTLGFRINPEKSDLVPSQVFTYLGMIFNTRSFTVSPKQDRVLSLLHLATEIKTLNLVSLRRLLQLLGKMESVASLLPLGRVRKRPFQRLVQKLFPDQTKLDDETPVSLELQNTLQIWTNLDWLQSSVPIRPKKVQAFVTTDASMVGWGAHMNDHTIQGVWNSEESNFHINNLELLAIDRALKHFLPYLKGLSVVIHGDNTTSLAYLRKQGGTKSENLSILAENILTWCHLNNITISVEFVPGKLNVLADQLSRASSPIPTEWSLHFSVLEPVWRLWGRPHVDLFATRFNSKLPLFVSPYPDPQALAVNAFAMHWENLCVYAYPPISLLPKVLEKFRKERPSMILIAPYWPAQPWLADLQILAKEAPISLHVTNRLLTQGNGVWFHPNPNLLQLHAWRL